MTPALTGEWAFGQAPYLAAAPCGWHAVSRQESRAWFFDNALNLLCSIDLPRLTLSMPWVVAMPDLQRFLVSGDNQLVMIDKDGSPLWQRRLDVGVCEQADVFVAADGMVWALLPNDPDQLAVIDPRTGVELTRIALDTQYGSAWFIAHPDNIHIGLHVGMGQDGSSSYWARLHGGVIQVAELAGEALCGIDSAGHRYLMTSHDGQDLTMHAFPDGRELAYRDTAALHDAAGGFRLDFGPILLNDTYVLAVLLFDDPDDEHHVLLSTDTLGWADTLTYPVSGGIGSPRAGALPGHWLTMDMRVGTARSWKLPGS